jgi:hypothetical protein
MQNPLRECRKCGLKAMNEMDLNLFQKGKKSLYGRHNFCKSCDNFRAKEDKEKNPDLWLKNKRDASFKKIYGITLEQRSKYILSVGKCEICSKGVTEKTAHIDHSHDSNRIKHIRGVLCNNCNTGLGKFKDNVDLLNKAAKYLIEREYMINPEPFDLSHGLDKIFHSGLGDAWKAQIQAVKDRFPKE